MTVHDARSAQFSGPSLDVHPPTVVPVDDPALGGRIRTRALGSNHMRVLVTGVAGMIGSHLTELILDRGDEVVGVDNYLTGQASNVEPLLERPRFSFVRADVCDAAAVESIGQVDAVCQLASPASPADFSTKPGQILRAGSVGVLTTLDVALEHGARYLLASTSEVYGEPLVHPQPETYWGNVHTVGPRACYDESKRFAEAAVSTYGRSFGLDAAIARIFNTYGPRMRVDDGRVVSNFIVQALLGRPLTVFGDGSQTRSFCFVEDQARGLLALLDSGQAGPVNIGNPEEFTVLELATLVIELTGSDSEIEHRPLPQDDPTQRRPDITRAREVLGWEPTVTLRQGLPKVIDYFERHLVA
jgi:dTDP-glucose 4,6-dehydratase